MFKIKLICLTVTLLFTYSVAQNIGDYARIYSQNPKGVPVHPASGDNSFERWYNGTLVSIEDIDTNNGWYKIELGGKTGWVTPKYVFSIDEEFGESTSNEIPSYLVGTWNIEYLKEGHTRGFPEYTQGGPTYDPRTLEDYYKIAEVIQNDLDAKIMILNEINGQSTSYSEELEKLVNILGNHWQYRLSSTGNSQRIAFLYDTMFVRAQKIFDINIEEKIVDNKDIFDRDPIVGYFQFKIGNGELKNDLIIIGLHLASGQTKLDNHNEAMNQLREKLIALVQDGEVPSNEKDILIGGDFNASRYDNYIEEFWNDYIPDDYDLITLAPEFSEEYLATRLGGVPLHPKSKIDYLMASKIEGGLFEELTQATATVHHELLGSDFNEFRKSMSDHIPVTIRIKLTDDND